MKQQTLELPRKEEKRPLPMGWRWVRLGEVCEINPRRPNDLNRDDEEVTSFVPMPAVDARLGVILNAETRSFGEVKKGYTYFEEGDVLFAKITPCMQNGKHAIATGLIGGFGFGTTEFHVLRPSSEILSNWIHRFLRQPEILKSAIAYFTGAVGQQRIPPSFLYNLQIPLPPLPEQKRIAGILTEQMAVVERARAAAQTQLDAAKALPAAYLRAVFNTPEVDSWPEKRLGEIGQIVSGVTLGRKLPDGETRRVPYLRVANVKDGLLDLIDVYEIEATEAEIKKLRLNFGDLLLTEGGDPDKLGRGTFWAGQLPECIHQNHIFRVRFDLNQVFPQFASYQIASQRGKAYFLTHAKRTTGIATINQKVLAGFPFKVPLFKTQKTLAANLNKRITMVEGVIAELQEKLRTINALPAAVLRRAFNGEL